MIEKCCDHDDDKMEMACAGIIKEGKEAFGLLGRARRMHRIFPAVIAAIMQAKKNIVGKEDFWQRGIFAFSACRPESDQIESLSSLLRAWP